MLARLIALLILGLSEWTTQAAFKSINYTHIFQLISPPLSSEHSHSKAQNQQFFQHPTCMQRWQQDKIPQIQQTLHQIFSPVQPLLDHEGCPTSKLIVITGNQETMIRSLGHFPHYADIFFRFYSLVLWQKLINPTNTLDLPCVHHFLINQTYFTVWKRLLNSKLWITELTTRLNHAFGENLLVTNHIPSEYAGKHLPLVLASKAELKFIHPSDAFLLTSALLGRDPCRYYGQGASLLRIPTLKIVILNRSGSRGILNLNETMETLKQSVTNSQIAIHSFEKYSFLQQVETMVNTDLVLSVHGAALTNVVFMRPCSIVVEVLPWLYPAFRFFRGFAESADVLHYEWMEGPNRTMYFSNKQTKACSQLLERMKEKQFQDPVYRETFEKEDIHSNRSLNAVCSHNHACRVCARSPRGLYLRQDRLQTVIAQAVIDRQQCIRKHPYYHKLP